VVCDAIYICRILPDLHDSAFALSGLMIAVMEIIGTMIDIQEPAGYPHPCRTLDNYLSRGEYLLWSSTKGPQSRVAHISEFQVLSIDIFVVAVDAAGLCCTSITFYCSLICSLFASLLLPVAEILGKIFPFSMLL
jgi:hypothetical protein